MTTRAMSTYLSRWRCWRCWWRGAARARRARAAAGRPRDSGGSDAPKGGKLVKVALPTAQTSFANADIAVAQKKGYFKQQGIGSSCRTSAPG